MISLPFLHWSNIFNNRMSIIVRDLLESIKYAKLHITVKLQWNLVAHLNWILNQLVMKIINSIIRIMRIFDIYYFLNDSLFIILIK